MSSAPNDSILDEAKRLVYGGREQDYGAPTDDFTRVVGLLNVLFADRLKRPLYADDWPLIMICAKLARQAHLPKRDNLVDIAGYAETAHRVLLAKDATTEVAPIPAVDNPYGECCARCGKRYTTGYVPANGQFAGKKLCLSC